VLHFFYTNKYTPFANRTFTAIVNRVFYLFIFLYLFEEKNKVSQIDLLAEGLLMEGYKHWFRGDFYGYPPSFVRHAVSHFTFPAFSFLISLL